MYSHYYKRQRAVFFSVRPELSASQGLRRSPFLKWALPVVLVVTGMPSCLLMTCFVIVECWHLVQPQLGSGTGPVPNMYQALNPKLHPVRIARTRIVSLCPGSASPNVARWRPWPLTKFSSFGDSEHGVIRDCPGSASPNVTRFSQMAPVAPDQALIFQGRSRSEYGESLPRNSAPGRSW